jgi:ABC-type lipoprotein release transport system permease subunit
MSGYSGTPLAKKLGIKEGFKIQLVKQPENYFELFTDFPQNVEISNSDLHDYDFIHIFSKDIQEADGFLLKMKNKIKPNGMIWISWPKKSSGLNTNLSGNEVRSLGLSHGLVDIKVCAVNNIWSGLKFVIPVKKR